MKYTFSKSDITRYIVTDHSLIIEEFTTETICKLLNIDKAISKAFGHNSGSLSFYQKMLLIKDVKGINTEISKKIEVFSQIRNKFLHLREVENWKDFFSISKTYSKIEKDLKVWYQNDESNIVDYEQNIRQLYFDLTYEIFKFLVDIHIEFEENKRRANRLAETREELYKHMEKKIRNMLGIVNIEKDYRNDFLLMMESRYKDYNFNIYEEE